MYVCYLVGSSVCERLLLGAVELEKKEWWGGVGKVGGKLKPM